MTEDRGEEEEGRPKANELAPNLRVAQTSR